MIHPHDSIDEHEDAREELNRPYYGRPADYPCRRCGVRLSEGHARGYWTVPADCATARDGMRGQLCLYRV